MNGPDKRHLAAMGFLVRMDFEGDQWTFFKPPHADVLAPRTKLSLIAAELLRSDRSAVQRN